MVKKALIVVGIFVGAAAVWAECQDMYHDSRPTFIHGWGQACSDTGAGCTECSNGSGQWCVVAGEGTCEPFNQNPNP